MKKTTLTKQFMMIIWGVIALAMLFCWVVLSHFAERYYQYTRLSELEDAFEVLDDASKEGTLMTDEFKIEIEKITMRNNMDLIIYDEKGTPAYISGSDSEMMVRRYFNLLMSKDFDADESVIKRQDGYMIIKQHDDRIETDYMTMFANLHGGESVLMSFSLENIIDVAAVFNKYIIFVGLLVIALSGVVVFYVSKSVTVPVTRLTEISRRMSNLEFDAKYEPTGLANEIDELGTYMNKMSEKLENTIGELKEANVKLQEDLSKREEVEKRRTEFLSGVSHELKTPIAIIQGYAEGLEDCVNDDEESRDYYCQVIKDEAQKMNHIVQEMLDLTHIEYGQDFVNMSRFNLIELIYGMVNSAAILTEQEGIKVKLPEQTELYVWADEGLTEKVVDNYLSNAIHYCGDEKEISISCIKKDGLVRVEVYNSGTNIAEEDLERIWEKFYKVDKARTREYGGSGIGLSVVKAIMEVMGREYGVYNEEKGVTFWFELESAN